MIKIDTNGTRLLLHILRLSFCITNDRLLVAYQGNQIFGENTSKSVAFSGCITQILEETTGENGNMRT